MTQKGTIFVVSAPSGGGKDTIIGAVKSQDDNLVHAVSATTRKPRNSEIDGQHYWFMNVDEFKEKVEQGEFMEWAEVHGHFYGTLKADVEKQVKSGRDVVLELDIQGARIVKFDDSDVRTIFIVPPSLEVLEKRIRDRGGLQDFEIKTRMLNAEIELKARNEYDYIIMNDVLEDAVKQFKQILEEIRKNRQNLKQG